MPETHPTAIVDPSAELDDSVVVGPYCIVGPGVRVGAGTRLIAQVHLQGPLTLGKNNTLYPFAVLGGPAQDLKVDPDEPGAGLVVGDDNFFREGATLNRATQDEPTRVGDRNYFMANTHAGHDCRVGNDCVLANGAVLGGHVHLGNNVILGGNAGIAQFVRVGRLTMIAGAEGVTLDVPPFCMVHHTRQVSALNLVGLRRAGYRDHINNLRAAFDLLYREGHTTPNAAALILDQFSDDPICREFGEFLQAADRGVTQFGQYK
ncbi:MAG: acyl-ACP--UDP-N-acetylglucosamine O-acyltransferase [Planctomycetota bacterium]